MQNDVSCKPKIERRAKREIYAPDIRLETCQIEFYSYADYSREKCWSHSDSRQ